MNLSFYELVNTYRISEAQKILQAFSKSIKIEYLGYQVGYKSKSAFFIAFKKQTAMTPAQYRKQFHFAE